MSRHALAALTLTGALLQLALGGCSFLVSFPEEQGEGGAGGACVDPEWVLIVEDVIFTAAPGSSDDVALLGGLAWSDQIGGIYAFGSTTAFLEGHDLPPSQTHTLFLVSAYEDHDSEIVMTAAACEAVSGNPFARRLALLSDGRVVVSGTLPTAEIGPATWGISPGEADACSSAETVSPVTGENNGTVPFFALLTDGDPDNSLLFNPAGASTGIALDIDARAGHVAGIGVARGQVFEQMSDSLRFFVQRSTESTPDETFVLAELFANDYEFPALLSAAVAVDDEGTAWFGGGTCPQAAGCDPEAFLGRLAASSSDPDIIERADQPSTITALEIGDGLLLGGGRYQGALQLLDVSLPQADDFDPFVFAMDLASQSIVWTYPGDDSSSLQRAGWSAVTGLATLGDRDCGGAVYVIGCTDPDAEDCSIAKPGKRGFIVKLDLADGTELWATEIDASPPALFLPTAITSATDRLWIAATLRGEIDVAGYTLTTGAASEAAIFRVTP